MLVFAIKILKELSVRTRELYWTIDHPSLAKAHMMLEFGMWGLNKIYILFAKFFYKKISKF